MVAERIALVTGWPLLMGFEGVMGTGLEAAGTAAGAWQAMTGRYGTFSG